MTGSDLLPQVNDVAEATKPEGGPSAVIPAEGRSPAYATVNPCRACQPLGTVLAFRGIEGAMVLLHGSQGCSTYMRLYLTRHFREPFDVASSALNEKDAVYGGAANLRAGLVNLISRYRPKVVGVSSTCLSETIGDDLKAILRDFSRERASELKDGRCDRGRHRMGPGGIGPHGTGPHEQEKRHGQPEDVPVLVPISTPSFEGSAVEGFGNALCSLVRAVAGRGDDPHRDGQINVFVGNISSADARELRRLLEGTGAPHALIPDVSETLDAPLTCALPLIPTGGTPLGAVQAAAAARASLTLGWERNLHLAGRYLETEHRVPAHFAPLPLGLTLTDRFLAKVSELAGSSPRQEEVLDRGRLLDALADCHRLTYGRRVGIYGEPDMVFGLLHLVLEMGMEPVLVATGSPDSGFDSRVRALLDTVAATANAPESSNSPESPAQILVDADFEVIEKALVRKQPHLLLGHSHGAEPAARLGVPLVRAGFPVYDRFGAQRFLHLGYRGAIRLVDEIANTLVERGGALGAEYGEAAVQSVTPAPEFARGDDG